jgi:hypothetical protein
MERKDHKKTVRQEWEANYNARGHATVNESTTELTGTRREADLIVRGLKALRAQVELREAAGVAAQDDKRWGDESLGAAPNTQELDALIESVAQPVYVAEPEVTTQYL